MQHLGFRVIFALSFAFSCAAVNWLITGQGSPFHDYLRYNVALPNSWKIIHILPFMLAGVIDGNADHPNKGAMLFFSLVQWLAIGLILSFLFKRGSSRTNLIG